MMMDNSQALGYMLLACKKAGIAREDVEKLFDEMRWMFQCYTVEEAEEKGFQYYDSLFDE